PAGGALSPLPQWALPGGEVPRHTGAGPQGNRSALVGGPGAAADRGCEPPQPGHDHAALLPDRPSPAPAPRPSTQPRACGGADRGRGRLSRDPARRVSTMTRDDDMPQATRRRFLIETAAVAGAVGIALPLAVKPASATPASMRAAIRKVVGEAELNKGKVKIDVPPLIENGNAVPLTISCESPMTADDHVKAMHVFTEKNPQPNVVSVQLGPRSGRAAVSTRIRLADSQKVIAIAQ